MTVAELIAELQKQPPEMLVVVDGYELGYDNISSIDRIAVDLDENSDPDDPALKEDWWNGRHEHRNLGDPGATEAVLLSRGRARR